MKQILLVDSWMLLFWLIFHLEIWILPMKNWENSIFLDLKGDNSLKQYYQGEVIKFCQLLSQLIHLSMSIVVWTFQFNILMLTSSCILAYGTRIACFWRHWSKALSSVNRCFSVFLENLYTAYKRGTWVLLNSDLFSGKA